MDSKAASVCGCSIESWLPAVFCPSSLLAPCLQGTSRHVPAPRDESLLVFPPGSEEQEEEKEAEEKEDEEELVMPKSSDAKDAKATIGEETVSTSAQSSVVDPLAAAPTDAEELDPSSDLSAEGQLPQQVESMGNQPAAEEEVQAEKPNFAGVWNLVRTEGDLERLLSDMGQGWLIRNGAKALKYGIGRVVVECEQDRDDLKFSKVLCDPRNLSKSHVHITVGQGTVRFLDDIGRLSSTSRWDGSSLVFDAKLESSGLSVTLLMYFNGEGNFVEEMVSCKGTVAKYIFDRRV